MSYSKGTDFSAKDFLLTGNPSKIIRGAEIDDEFNAIQSEFTNGVIAKTASTGSAKFPAGTQAQRDVSPAAGYIRFNNTTGAFEGYDGSVWGPVGSNNGPVVDIETYTATSGQTVFTLVNGYAPGMRQIEVFIDGVNQYPSAYTETDYRTVTFTSGLTVGADVKFAIWRTDTLTDGDAANMSYNPGAGATVTTVQAKLRESVSVLDFGAINDSTTDQSAAIQAAIDYAVTLVTGGYTISGRTIGTSQVIVSLAGGNYGIGSTLRLVSKPGVIIQDGTLTAISPLTSTDYIIRFGGGTVDTRSEGASIRNVVLECGHICNGILWKGNVGGRNNACVIHGFTNYGVRAITNGGDTVWTGFRITKYWYGETGYDLKANRTGSAFSLEDADHILQNCIMSYCKYPIALIGFFNTQIVGCHTFNGATNDLVDLAITAAADNGSGFLRLTVADTTGIANTDLCIVPWLKGVSNAGGSTAGVYAASNVTATTIDFVDYTFAGTWDNTTSAAVRLWADEQVGIYMENTRNAVISGHYLDSGKIQCDKDSNFIMTGSYVTGSNSTFWVAVELLNDGGVSEAFNGVQASGNICNINRFVRVTEINGGTTADPIHANMHGNTYTDTGNPLGGVGQFGVGPGTANRPAITFTTLNNEDSSTTSNTDTNTGIYHPSEDHVAIATGGVNAAIFDDSQRLLLGNPTSAVSMLNVLNRFQVAGSSTATSTAGFSRFSADDTGPNISIGKSRNATTGDYQAAGQVQAGDSLGVIYWAGNGTDSSTTLSSAASLRVEVVDPFTSGTRKSRFVIGVAGSGGTAVNDRLYIDYLGSILPVTDITASLGTATERFNAIYAAVAYIGAGGARWSAGTGTPEGLVTAVVGSMYTRTDGGAGTTLYVKESGTGDTGWVAK